MNNRFLPGLFLLVPALLALSSCIRKDFDETKCNRLMRIELHWIETMPVDYAERVHIDIVPDGATSIEEIFSDVYGVDVELPGGKYHIYGWEEHTGAELDLLEGTVSISDDGSRALLDPSIFSAGRTTATVDYKVSQIIPLPMYRQVRPLVVEINFTGAGVPLLEALSGSLSGIALERDMDQGFPPVNGLERQSAIRRGNIPYTFQSTEGPGTGVWYTGTRNLIGLDGQVRQTLSLEASFAGTPDPVAYEFDIVQQLEGYQTEDIDNPWYVTLTINLGASLEADIVDWISGPDSFLEAH